jgi:hypothetical protein
MDHETLLFSSHDIAAPARRKAAFAMCGAALCAIGAKTTALIEPDRLYLFSALHKAILDLRGA